MGGPCDEPHSRWGGFSIAMMPETELLVVQPRSEVYTQRKSHKRLIAPVQEQLEGLKAGTFAAFVGLGSWHSTGASSGCRGVAYRTFVVFTVLVQCYSYKYEAFYNDDPSLLLEYILMSSTIVSGLVCAHGLARFSQPVQLLTTAINAALWDEPEEEDDMDPEIKRLVHTLHNDIKAMGQSSWLLLLILWMVLLAGWGTLYTLLVEESQAWLIADLVQSAGFFIFYCGNLIYLHHWVAAYCASVEFCTAVAARKLRTSKDLSVWLRSYKPAVELAGSMPPFLLAFGKCVWRTQSRERERG